MKKLLAPILTIAIVAALAGVLTIRTNVESPSSVSDDQPLVATDDPTIFYAVSGIDGVYAYHIPSATQDGPTSAFDGVGRLPFTHGSDQLCGRDLSVTMFVTCGLDENNVLTIRIGGDEPTSTVLVDATVDPKAFGLEIADGYLWPIAIADDHTAVYLGRRVETESWVAGLWKLDVATGDVMEVSYVRDNGVYQYEINPATKQLIGTSFTPPEGLGEPPTGPSRIVLIDLETGNALGLDERAHRVFENALLSDDGSFYSAQVYLLPTDRRDIPETAVTNVVTGERVAEFDGVVRDWFGDTVVFDRDGNLFLYDLKTGTETQLTSETDAYVEYLGAAY